MTSAADCKSAMSLLEELREFGARSYALLVDESEPAPCVAGLRELDCKGIFTFTLEGSGRSLLGRKVGLLPLDTPPPCDAWIVATGSKAVYGLTQYLVDAGRQSEIVFTAVRRRFAPMYSYVDFFKGETRTVLYFHNVFERTYKIHLPIAVRWLLRDARGKVVKASQMVVRGGETVTLDSRTLDLEDGFAGCLELYADVRELNGPIVPFLHMNCDYISADDVTTLHQSGLKPWPAATRFVRGLVPEDADSALTVSLFNKMNAAPIHCTATLRYSLGGTRREDAKPLPEVPRNQLVFVNVNDLFRDVLAQGATAADLVIEPDKDMHRPNYYLHKKSRKQSWYGLEHGAGAHDEPLAKSRLERFAGLNLLPWICPFPVPHAATGAEVDLVYFHEGDNGLHDFTGNVYDADGRLVLSERLRLELGQRLNLRAWCREHGVRLDEGLANLAPAPDARTTPNTFSFMASFYHRGKPKLSPVVVGGAPYNVPYEVDRSALWNHPAVPIVHSEQFGKGIVSEEFDTLIVLYNASADKRYARSAVVDIDLMTWDARAARIRRVIAPNGCLTMRMSELLADARLSSEREYYSVWIYSRECFVTGFHMLYRKADHALGVEHFYYGRFNIPETA